MSHLSLGQAPEGVAALEKATSLSREPVGLGYLGCAYALVGRQEDARAILDELLARRAERFVPLKPFILLYTALGDIDRALDALEDAHNQRDPTLLAMTAVPLFARLQGHSPGSRRSWRGSRRTAMSGGPSRGIIPAARDRTALRWGNLRMSVGVSSLGLPTEARSRMQVSGGWWTRLVENSNPIALD